MTCGEFLARHSEYLDEELAAEAAVEMRLHLVGCARCGRYDRVLRRGLSLLRDMEPIRPARDPLDGFYARLAATPRAREQAPPRAPLAATVAVAGVVALVAWSALFRLAGVPGTAAGEPVRGATATRPADVDGSLVPGAPPVLTGMDLVGAARPARAVEPLGTPSAVQPEPGAALDAAELEPGPAWTRAAELRAASELLPVRSRFLVPGPYTPLLLLPPEFGQRAQVVSVSGPGPR